MASISHSQGCSGTCTQLPGAGKHALEEYTVYFAFLRKQAHLDISGQQSVGLRRVGRAGRGRGRPAAVRRTEAVVESGKLHRLVRNVTCLQKWQSELVDGSVKSPRPTPTNIVDRLARNKMDKEKLHKLADRDPKTWIELHGLR